MAITNKLIPADQNFTKAFIFRWEPDGNSNVTGTGEMVKKSIFFGPRTVAAAFIRNIRVYETLFKTCTYNNYED